MKKLRKLPLQTEVIIPAYNEEESIGFVLAELKKIDFFRILVINNNSSDQTAARAAEQGATVLSEPIRGYGQACWKGIENLDQATEVVLFIDADYSDFPPEASLLLEPIMQGRADLVIGSRNLGKAEPGALLPQARFGNWLAGFLIKRLYGFQFTDLGPFRAITRKSLTAIAMEDRQFGWTVEMQVKALKLGLRVEEVSVSYRKRIGVSKISGTLKGSILAGFTILYTIFKYHFTKKNRSIT